MRIRTAALVIAGLTILSLSGCVATAARSDPSISNHFQPLIGTRGSLYLISQSAQTAILRIDEDGESASTEDAGMSLLMLTMFATDLPATAAVDLVYLPGDLAAEAKKVTLTKDAGRAD